MVPGTDAGDHGTPVHQEGDRPQERRGARQAHVEPSPGRGARRVGQRVGQVRRDLGVRVQQPQPLAPGGLDAAAQLPSPARCAREAAHAEAPAHRERIVAAASVDHHDFQLGPRSELRKEPRQVLRIVEDGDDRRDAVE